MSTNFSWLDSDYIIIIEFYYNFKAGQKKLVDLIYGEKIIGFDLIIHMLGYVIPKVI